jgi:hypothetical protein
MGPPIDHAAFRPGSGVFERRLRDSLKELNTNSERLTSFITSGVNAGEVPATGKTQPPASGGTERRHHPVETVFVLVGESFRQRKSDEPKTTGVALFIADPEGEDRQADPLNCVDTGTTRRFRKR